MVTYNESQKNVLKEIIEEYRDKINQNDWGFIIEDLLKNSIVITGYNGLQQLQILLIFLMDSMSINLLEYVKKIPDALLAFTSRNENLYTGFTSLKIPDNIQVVTDYTFYNCFLKHIEIGSGIKRLPVKCFYHPIMHLESIVLPDSIVDIGEYCFFNCKDLKTIKLPNNPKFTKIPTGCFAGCEELEHVDIPDNVEYLDDNCFYNCGNVKIYWNSVGTGSRTKDLTCMKKNRNFIREHRG